MSKKRKSETSELVPLMDVGERSPNEGLFVTPPVVNGDKTSLFSIMAQKHNWLLQNKAFLVQLFSQFGRSLPARNHQSLHRIYHVIVDWPMLTSVFRLDSHCVDSPLFSQLVSSDISAANVNVAKISCKPNNKRGKLGFQSDHSMAHSQLVSSSLSSISDSPEYFLPEDQSPVGLEAKFHTIITIIKNFCLRSLNYSPTSLYVCGSPGTGKSTLLAAVQRVCTAPESPIAVCLSEVVARICFVDINAVIYSQCRPGEIFKVLLSQIAKRDIRAMVNDTESAEVALRRLFIDAHQKCFSDTTRLGFRHQNMLYTLFKWSHTIGSNMILIGITNTCDLPSRHLPRLIELKIEPLELVFKTYTESQIVRIIRQRLQFAWMQSYQVFVPCSNVSSTAGSFNTTTGSDSKKTDILMSHQQVAIDISGSHKRRAVGLLTCPSDNSSAKTLPIPDLVDEYTLSEHTPYFEQFALKFCAKKVERKSGDLRKCLAFCEAAVKVASTEFEPTLNAAGPSNSALSSVAFASMPLNTLLHAWHTEHSTLAVNPKTTSETNPSKNKASRVVSSNQMQDYSQTLICPFHSSATTVVLQLMVPLEPADIELSSTGLNFLLPASIVLQRHIALAAENDGSQTAGNTTLMKFERFYHFLGHRIGFVSVSGDNFVQCLTTLDRNRLVTIETTNCGGSIHGSVRRPAGARSSSKGRGAMSAAAVCNHLRTNGAIPSTSSVYSGAAIENRLSYLSSHDDLLFALHSSGNSGFCERLLAHNISDAERKPFL